MSAAARLGPNRFRVPAPASRAGVLSRRAALGKLALKSVLRGLDRDGFGADPPALLAKSYMAFCLRLAAGGVSAHLGLGLFSQRLAKGKALIGIDWVDFQARPGRNPGRAGGYFEFAEPDQGHKVWLLPLIAWTFESRAECYEILALDQEDTALWWRHTGDTSVLGEAALAAAMDEQSPLTLIRDPLTWARHGGDSSGAVCLLDLDAPSARTALLSVEEIRCADLAHGEEVKKLQARLRPKLPKVMVAR